MTRTTGERPKVTRPVVFVMIVAGGLLGSLAGIIWFDVLLHRPLAPGEPADDGSAGGIACLFVGFGAIGSGLGLGIGLIVGSFLFLRDEARDLDASPYEAYRRRPFS